MEEILAFVVMMVVGLLLILGTLGGIGYVVTAYECNGYEDATGKPTKMKALNCYIKDGEQWYMWSEYKYRLVTKGEFAK